MSHSNDFLSWVNVKNFYQYYCKSNKEFLENIHEIPRTGYNDTSVNVKNEIINTDIIESLNQEEELTELYKQQKLITSRMGCVEITFMIKYMFNYDLPTHLTRQTDIDHNMRANAGLYYKDPETKEEIWEWWCEQTKELLLSETITSCYCILNFDLSLWALLNLKKKFYNYSIISKILLQHSEGKKILYIGSGVESIKAGYDRGLQNAWKFPVSDFSMYYLKTPQTTTGCIYPHSSIKETCEILVKEIDEKFKDFDTAVLGCGAYGPPIINILRKKYPKKNICYIGAECYKMFGVYSKGMPYQHYNDAIKENWIEVRESVPPGAEKHPEKKYWK
jgi:hypothetical protein